MTTEFRYGPQPPRHTDPDYISAMEHFESIPHERIHAGTEKIDAGEILLASQVWLEAAGTLATAMPLTRGNLEIAMNGARWEGAAADAAEAATRGIADSFEELAAVMGEVGARLGALAAAAEAVKLAVVPPGDSGPIGALARILEAAHVVDAQLAQEALRQEALLAMNMIYKPGYTAAGTAIPALPEPPGLPGVAPEAPYATNPPAPQAVPPNNSTPRQDRPAPRPPAPEQPRPEAPAQPQTPSQPTPAPQPSAPSTPAPQAPPTTPPPSPEHTPSPQAPAPQPPTTTSPAPPPPSPAPPPPAPPSPAPPPPAPAPAEPGPPLSDQEGQPGITGPIPETSTPTTPDQPGVSPPRR
ncbi:hypothetical protein BJY24_007574 [Nocardia transvalensis]|uniref:Uncharacterized protein n=1 Tax=Nocardia transvalensis TaxID=37333 RepID=A0A7W9UMS0_9NOCA|nr:hypothetical protein [Nocardia transvalensis]MBB5918662.1 hypothetical protein [Nocardia transvalensis]